MDDNNLIIEILVKHSLRQKLSGEEMALLEQWRAQSDNHRLLLKKFRNSRWVAEQRRQLHAAPTAEMWEDIRRHIDQEGEPAPVFVLPARRRFGRRTVAIAVGCGLLLAGGAWFFLTGKEQPEATSATRVHEPAPARPPKIFRNLLQRSDGSYVLLDTLKIGAVAAEEGGYLLRKTDTIDYRLEGRPGGKSNPLFQRFLTGAQGKAFLHWPDSTTMCLNRASNFRYPENLLDGKEVVELDGEAGFYIAGNASRTWTIRIGRGDSVQVLGTTFDVRAYSGETDHWVAVVSGAVKVSSGNKTALLKKDQEARIGVQDLDLTKMSDPSSALAWVRPEKAEPFFAFDHTPMRTALRMLASWYQVTIANPENAKGKVISGKLSRKQGPEVALQNLLQAQDSTVSLRLLRDTFFVATRGLPQR